MTSWAIVGATRGIGFEYVQQLSSDPKTTVLALIRSQKTAGPLNDLAKQRKNIHVVETDISNPSTLQATAEKVSTITGGSLDVLICNAYSQGTEAIVLPPTAFTGKEQALNDEINEALKVNLFHTMYTINAFVPLVRKGNLKKIIYISSGMGDMDVTLVGELPSMLGYAVSKSAGNIVMAKYAVELKSEGIKTLALSPGWVDTDAAKAAAPDPAVFQFMLGAFQKIKPSVTGMISTEESVSKQLKVIEGLDETNSGTFISQNGNQDWF